MPLVKISANANDLANFLVNKDYFEKGISSLFTRIFNKPASFIMQSYNQADVYLHGSQGVLIDVFMTELMQNTLDSKGAPKPSYSDLVELFIEGFYEVLENILYDSPELNKRTYILFHKEIPESNWGWNGQAFSEIKRKENNIVEVQKS